jgi:hypothetical protein
MFCFRKEHRGWSFNMASKSGISKNSNTKGNKVSRLPEMEQLANDNLISSKKIDSAAAQATIWQERHPTGNSSYTHDGGEPYDGGSIDQANSSPPSNSSVVEYFDLSTSNLQLSRFSCYPLVVP